MSWALWEAPRPAQFPPPFNPQVNCPNDPLPTPHPLGALQLRKEKSQELWRTGLEKDTLPAYRQMPSCVNRSCPPKDFQKFPLELPSPRACEPHPVLPPAPPNPHGSRAACSQEFPPIQGAPLMLRVTSSAYGKSWLSLLFHLLLPHQHADLNWK